MKMFRGFGRWFKDGEKPDGWAGAIEPIETDRDMTGAFAIEENHPLWLAVHQVINEAEKECMEGAAKYVANTNMCISAVGATEECGIIRRKLIERREVALKQFHGGKINA